MLPTALLVLATIGCLGLGTFGIPLHPASKDESRATTLAAEIRAQLREEVEGMVSEAVERATRTLREENLILRSQLISSQKPEVSRKRRTLNDITSIKVIVPSPSYLNEVPDSFSSAIDNRNLDLDFFPTTSAQDWTFFEMSASNTGTFDFLGSPVEQKYALGVASHQRCVDDQCTVTSKTRVPQPIFSWHPAFGLDFNGRWLNSGPGASWGDSSIFANGAKTLAHLSIGGADYIIPASFEEDCTNITLNPTRQCVQMWQWDNTAGTYTLYDSCITVSQGSTDVVPLSMNGETYLLVGSQVERRYDATCKLISESYSAKSQRIFKWSSTPAPGHPDGRFLAVPFQTIAADGVNDIEVFQISGETFFGLSEYARSVSCAVAGEEDCKTVEIVSRIFKFSARATNGNDPGYVGSFLELQEIPTNGARAMHFFSTAASGQKVYFLAIAEQRDDKHANVQSSIWKWNGERFGLFQRIDTVFAEDVDSFVENDQVFLIFANRGCPSADDSACENVDVSARTTLWSYNSFKDQFVRVSESDDISSLHPFEPTSFAQDGTPITPTALPSGITVFRLPRFEFGTFGEPRTFLAIANARVKASDTIDSCEGSKLSSCHPANLFRIELATTAGIKQAVAGAQNMTMDQDRRFMDLESKLYGGDNIFYSIRNDPSYSIRNYGAESAATFDINGNRFFAMGNSESYMTYQECVDWYTNASAPLYMCTHLNSNQSIARPDQCGCSTDGSGNVVNPKIPHRVTKVQIYRLENYLNSASRFVEYQTIAAQGVSDLHFFAEKAAVLQSYYDNCDTTCVRNIDVRYVLAVASSQHTCDTNYITETKTGGSLHESLGVDFWQWNNETRKFEMISAIKSQCRIVSSHSFSVLCQDNEGQTPLSLSCGSYVALVEDCRDAALEGSFNTTLSISFRVTFHKWDQENRVYRHCQPHPDPGHADNRNSYCRQPADPHRMLYTESEHVFDFPDLLPFNLQVGVHLEDDLSGYQPQLKDGDEIAAIDFFPLTAQKNIYFSDDVGDEVPVKDDDEERYTLYGTNGRRKYELGMAIVYKASSPQIFALDALYPKSQACVSTHATTPRRREFRFVQALDSVSGGRDVTHFQRISQDGVVKTYVVFPEATGDTSSVFINEVCDERVNVTTGVAFLISKPSPTVNFTLPAGDREWCPYSDHPVHFEAWEAFMNYYNPFGTCKGFTPSPALGSGAIEPLYYNRLPPPGIEWRRELAGAGASQFVYRRAEGAAGSSLPFSGYSTTNYLELYSRRDEILAPLQEVATTAAQSASVHQLCGEGGQTWLVFSQYNPRSLDKLDSEVPASLTSIYVWNDAFAVNRDGVSCTSGAARDLAASSSASDRLKTGCFETKQISSPPHTGVSVGTILMEENHYLSMAFLKRGEGPRESAIVDPGACAVSQSADRRATAGVVMPVLTINLYRYGGVQCRTGLEQDAELLVDLPTINSLKKVFVSLDEDQVVRGKITFNAGIMVNNTLNATDAVVTGQFVAAQFSVSETFKVDGDISIGGKVTSDSLVVMKDADVHGDVFASNFNTIGDVDEVDVSDLGNRVSSYHLRVALELTEQAATICNLTSGSSYGCRALVASTSCYPVESVSVQGFDFLQEEFSIFMRHAYPSVTLIKSFFVLYDPRAYFVVKARKTELAKLTFDTSAFFAQDVCAETNVPAAAVGFVNIPKILYFVLLSCRTITQEVIRQLRISTQGALAQYGVRTTDVITFYISCGRYGAGSTEGVGTGLGMYVRTTPSRRAQVEAAMSRASVWTQIYKDLVKSMPTAFIDLDEVLEIQQGVWVPTNDGSGAGEP